MLDWVGPILSPREIWLKNRKKSIGASDVPIIMGVSPYKNLIDLYQDKTSDHIDTSTNYAMEIGNTLEPIAREAYENSRCAKFDAANFNRGHYSCSLDGYNHELSNAIEIKYVGATFKDSCPNKYYPQIQFQYFVSGASGVDLVQINNAQEINIIQVPKDDEYISHMIERVDWFWDCVVNRRIEEIEKVNIDLYPLKVKRGRQRKVVRK